MTDERYPVEELGPEDDDGTMPLNVENLRDEVIGHKIVSVEKVSRPGRYTYWASLEKLEITLDNGKKVLLANTSDCCAYTEVENFLLHPELVDHVITGVGTTDGFSKWHIYADLGDVLELSVGWSSGNPFYYGYGFDITVEEQ